MKEHIKKIYFVFSVIVFVLMLYALLTMRLNMVQGEHKNGYEVVTSFTQNNIVDTTAPVDVRKIFTLSPFQTTGGYRHLIFYTIHQNVEVYAGEELIYTMGPAYYNKYGKTPGCVWNDVVIMGDYATEEIRVELIPVYSSGISSVPKFYFGEKNAIVRMILAENAMPVFLSLITIILGIILVVYVFYNFKNSEIDKNIALRGAFAIHIGLWRLFDTAGMKLIFDGVPAISMAPFIALSCAIVPFVLFFSDMMTTKKDKLWNLACGIGLAGSAIVLFTQYKNIWDFRESHLLTIILMLVLAVVTGIQAAYEYRHAGWSPALRRNTVFIGICIIAVCVDMAFYFLSGYTKTSSYGMFALLVYIIAISVSAGKDASKLAVEGMLSENYQKMAYQDQLTGLYNRTAMARDTERYSIDPEHYVVVMLDLNDLKKCNDTLGHEQGDIYIKDSARIIQSVFGTIGKCYRTGGDEFFCLIENGTRKECKEKIEELRKACDEYNAKSKLVKIVIACGYAAFDSLTDYDLQDTTKRADQMMYEDKARLKGLAKKENCGE